MSQPEGVPQPEPMPNLASPHEKLFALPKPEPLRIGFETYLSPYSYRYGSPEMRETWSQVRFWGNVRKTWNASNEVKNQIGLVSDEEIADLLAHEGDLSVERIYQFERDKNVGTRHDIGAAVAEYNEVATIGGPRSHEAMTSDDALGAAEMMQIYEAIGIIEPKIDENLEAFGETIAKRKDQVCMGFTHLQLAEPTTVGYRNAKYAQDLLIDKQFLKYTKTLLKAKGIKGPVGTSAAMEELLKDTGMTPEEHEARVMEKLGLQYVTISDQTYPRKMLFLTMASLASIAQTLHRYTLDLQVLSSSAYLEVSEYYKKGQIGSSAMPHKKNPINSENICSLTEALPGYLVSAWQTGANVTLERTLRDSAGKRSWLPEAFLAVDESLERAKNVTKQLIFRDRVIAANLRKYAPFAATELVMSKMIRSGVDRNLAHSILVEASETALEAVGAGEPNPMKDIVLNEPRITDAIGVEEAEACFEEILEHVGNAPRLCEKFLQEELYPAIGKAA